VGATDIDLDPSKRNRTEFLLSPLEDEREGYGKRYSGCIVLYVRSFRLFIYSRDLIDLLDALKVIIILRYTNKALYHLHNRQRAQNNFLY
jgi:hypothetical protein